MLIWQAEETGKGVAGKNRPASYTHKAVLPAFATSVPAGRFLAVEANNTGVQSG